MTGSINHTCCHLVVHILVRTWTLFLHLIGTFILCTTPETVVVFPTQILQNAVQAFRGLVTGYQPMPTNEKKKKTRGVWEDEEWGSGPRTVVCAHIQTQELRSLLDHLRWQMQLGI